MNLGSSGLKNFSESIAFCQDFQNTYFTTSHGYEPGHLLGIYIIENIAMILN